MEDNKLPSDKKTDTGGKLKMSSRTFVKKPAEPVIKKTVPDAAPIPAPAPVATYPPSYTPAPSYQYPQNYNQTWSQHQTNYGAFPQSQPVPISTQRPQIGRDVPKTFKTRFRQEEDSKVIKEAISNRLKSTTLVISSHKFDPLHCPKRGIPSKYEINEPKVDGLREFTIPKESNKSGQKEINIFELYITVPIKEEQERIKKEEEERKLKEEEERKRKEEEEELKRKEEEERKRKEEIARELRIRRNTSSGPMERIYMAQDDLEKILLKTKKEDREVIERCIKNMKEKGKLSSFMMKELGDLVICKEPVSENLVNPKLIKREFEKREGGMQGGRKGGYGKRDYKYEKRQSTYGEKRGGDKQGFVRKELTEDEKRMKDEASQVKNKMEERNKLVSNIELQIKMITNKITPTNYKSQKDDIVKMITECNYSEDTIRIIGKTIFNKACIEKILSIYVH